MSKHISKIKLAAKFPIRPRSPSPVSEVHLKFPSQVTAVISNNFTPRRRLPSPVEDVKGRDPFHGRLRDTIVRPMSPPGPRGIRKSASLDGISESSEAVIPLRTTLSPIISQCTGTDAIEPSEISLNKPVFSSVGRNISTASTNQGDVSSQPRAATQYQSGKKRSTEGRSVVPWQSTTEGDHEDPWHKIYIHSDILTHRFSNGPYDIVSLFKLLLKKRHIEFFRQLQNNFPDDRRYSKASISLVFERDQKTSDLPLSFLSNPQCEGIRLSLLSLVFEVLLNAPGTKENFEHLLSISEISNEIPPAMKLFFEARHASITNDSNKQTKLLAEADHLLNNYPLTPKDYAWIYDALGHIEKLKESETFEEVCKRKAHYHELAEVYRRQEKPVNDVELAVNMYERTISRQSHGFANAHIGCNGEISLREKSEYMTLGAAYHSEAVEEATKLQHYLGFKVEDMHKTDLTVSLRFDAMLRKLRPKQIAAQMEYYSLRWSTIKFHAEVQRHANMVRQERDRILYDLLENEQPSTSPTTILKQRMMEEFIPLIRDVSKGIIQGFTLDCPGMSE